MTYSDIAGLVGCLGCPVLGAFVGPAPTIVYAVVMLAATVWLAGKETRP